MVAYGRGEAADRAGVEPAYLDRLVELGIVAPEAPGSFSRSDVRRARLVRSLDEAGIPLDGLAAAIRRRAVSLAFLDSPSYERFAALSAETFQQVGDRTGIPIELLAVIREVMGLPAPSPDERVHEDEMAIVPFVELQVALGFRQGAIERLLRAEGDSLRRITESEGAWWMSEVIERMGPQSTTSEDLSDRLSPLAEQSMLAIYHAMQARAWTANIIGSFEVMLERAGLYSRLERPPAVCFLDITGYTRLTQERGDDAAADLAGTVARLVRGCSVQRGGKPIKWLGDGVMLLFPDPGEGVAAALEMVSSLAAADLPPAHVGLHAGPVIFQEGDYFGQTVNVTARIADYARPGEVLVSRAVADAAAGAAVAFHEIGPVELKGVAGTVQLLRAVAAS